MGLLDFLKTPKWKEVEKQLPSRNRIEAAEEDFWWIGDEATVDSQFNVDELYNHCLNTYTNLAQEAGLLDAVGGCRTNLIPTGEKVVSAILYDRYLIQRHETDPDIFYKYVVQLSLEAGVTIANKWKDASPDFDEYVQKIICETSFDDFRWICQQYFHMDPYLDWCDFAAEIYKSMYDSLKWYHEKENFEEYKLKALLAAFQLGVMLILDKRDK